MTAPNIIGFLLKYSSSLQKQSRAVFKKSFLVAMPVKDFNDLLFFSTQNRYWETVLEMSWPRFTYVVELNIDSIRNTDPQKLGVIDIRPHYVSKLTSPHNGIHAKFSLRILPGYCYVSAENSVSHHVQIWTRNLYFNSRYQHF